MSNKTKWTKGIWKINPKAKTHVECDEHGIASTGSWAARSMDSLDIEVEQHANANLIAAAPELYDALSDALDGKSIYDLSLETGWPSEHCQRWFDALAKARGEQ